MEQKNKELMIFLAGELRSKNNLQKKIQSGNYEFYAADGGYCHADELNLSLKRILGDFDSAEKPLSAGVLLFPSEKDETDSELALRLAIEEGYRNIWMIAPFGGRFDHSVANLHLLETAYKQGVSLKLYDGENLVFLLEAGAHVLNRDFRYISFFPWKETAKVSLTDFKYPLDKYLLIKEKPIGISNEPAGKCPTIQVHEGMVLCICIESIQEEI